MTRQSDQTTQTAEAPANPAPEGTLVLDQFLPYRLNLVSETVSRSFARLYAQQFAMDRPEWRVIAIVGQFGRVTAKTVSERSTMHKTKVSRAVAALEKKGFIERTPNPEDLREIFLDLTPEGRRAYDTLVPQALTFSRHLMDTLSPTERAQLETILGKLTEAAATFEV